MGDGIDLPRPERDALEALHASAMRWADVAVKRSGEAATRAWRIAARLEWAVARRLPRTVEPSRSILSRSAAAMFGRAGDRLMQGCAAVHGLDGEPPECIRGELWQEYLESFRAWRAVNRPPTA